jgi:hypothetical protein
MNAPSPVPWAACPECGAEIPADVQVCWLCRRVLPESVPAAPRDKPEAAANPFAPPGFGGYRYPHRASHTGTAILLTVLVAVLVGLFLIAPAAAAVVALLATPAVVVTLILATRRGEEGRPLSLAGQTGTFLGVLGAMIGLVLLVLAAIVVALMAICGAFR